MGLYRYNPQSPLTRWQQEKVYALCGERHPILSRRRAGNARPGDARLLRHIEREIDWYQMKEAKPGLDAMRAKLRQVNRFKRRVERLLFETLAKLPHPHHQDDSGGDGENDDGGT